MQWVETLFRPTDRAFVSEMLMSKCGFDVPGMRHSGQEDIDRVRCSVLKLSDGSVAALMQAVELAQVDVRDLFVSAGFPNPSDHEEWVPAKRSWE